jgi:type IV pilus assembly protein PilM
MASGTVSIYIDDTGLRVMVTRGKRITRLAEMAIEGSLSSIDTPQKETELAARISQLLKFNKISEKKIILGLSGLHCLTRPIILPELPRAMVDEAVVREAKRILPMPLEQLYLSWQVISVSGGKTRVFLAAVPRQMADMVIRVINKAGCKPYLMEIKPLALARLSKEASAVILDLQSKEFDIVIIVNGIPQPVRSIAFPQESLSLPDKFNIVKEDLKRTLDFVKTKGEEIQVKPGTALLVSGELAEHSELYEPLAEELGLKAGKLASPLKYLKYLEPAQYLVNSGLALKVIAKEAGPLLPNFNVLPAPYQPKHISMNKLMFVPAAAGMIGVLVLLAFSVQDAATNIQQVKSQLQSTTFMLDKKQAQKKTMTDQVANLKGQIQASTNEYNLYSSALKAMMVTGNNMNNDLAATIDNINTGLIVSAISISGLTIGITGHAEMEDKVFVYVRALTDTGRYAEITINSITSTGAGDAGNTGVDFSLTCRLKEDRK